MGSLGEKGGGCDGEPRRQGRGGMAGAQWGGNEKRPRDVSKESNSNSGFSERQTALVAATTAMRSDRGWSSGVRRAWADMHGQTCMGRRAWADLHGQTCMGRLAWARSPPKPNK